jgi:hypothetical protein
MAWWYCVVVLVVAWWAEIDEYRWMVADEAVRSNILIKAQEELITRVKQAVSADMHTNEQQEQEQEQQDHAGAAAATTPAAWGGSGGASATTGGAGSAGGGGGGGGGYMVMDGSDVYRGVRMPHGWRAVGEDIAIWQTNDPPPGPFPKTLTDTTAATAAGGGEQQQVGVRVAAFDFDDCVAQSGRQGGPTWSGDAKDWRMKFAHVPQVMRHLHEAGYMIAVLSNESMVRLKQETAIHNALTRKLGRIEAWA